MLRYLTFLAFFVLPAAASEVGRPDQFNLKAPEASVPAPCAKFAGGWGNATWDNGRATELWVEQIDANCKAVVVYGWGPYQRSRTSAVAGFRRLDAQVTDAKLEVPITEFNSHVQYEFVGNDLNAIFTDHQKKIFRTKLTKIR
jgi:hypothetical protein